jgi:hypothetical protein
MNSLSEFQTLALEVNIPVPTELACLILRGLTSYDQGVEKSAFRSTYDFEWITIDEARAFVSDWLNPRFQSGHLFLPFAISGAGDAFCIIQLNDAQHTTCCAMVPHDDDTCNIYDRNFADFATTRLIEAMSDLSHLADDVDEQSLAEYCRQDVRDTAACLPKDHAQHLLALAESELKSVEVMYGRRKQLVPALLSGVESDAAFARYKNPSPIAVTIVPPWEV